MPEPTSRRPTALLVEHMPYEGAGLLAGWLPDAGLDIERLRVHAGEPFPSVVSPASTGHAALVVMGGPMSAYDDEASPWLADELAMIQASVAAGTPVLGVCLGAQLLARALAGEVRRAAGGPELGRHRLSVTAAATDDPLLGGMPPEVDAVGWHWDEVVELPPGATVLAGSTACRHQAFRVGDSAWGLQFHPEVTGDMVAAWASKDADRVRAAGLDPAAVVADVREGAPALARCWEPVGRRFAEFVRSRRPGRSVELAVERFDSPTAAVLVERLQRDLTERYGGGDPTVLTPEVMAPPTGTFLLARLDGVAVACGGYRYSAPATAEIKRMYVEPAARRHGLARLLLAELERRAAAVGYRTVRLETGLGQPEAMALYESVGYRPVAPYAGHDDWPLSRCYARDVTLDPSLEPGPAQLA